MDQVLYCNSQGLPHQELNTRRIHDVVDDGICNTLCVGF